MGNLFVRKTKSTGELLQSLDVAINDAEEYQKTTQISQKRYVGYLMLFSSLVYLTAVVFGYFYYYPKDFHEVGIRLVPVFLFPFLIYALKLAGCWFFVLRLEANEQSLEKMKRNRRDLLERVKDKEIYNVAKEILEKFDPQLQLERLQRERKLEEEREQEMIIRQRALGMRRRRSLELQAPRGDGVPSGKAEFTPNGAEIGSTAPAPASKLVRPILPRDRSALDKVVDYLLGDGPNNRYALICSSCLSHNGMALQDDFEYVAYRCAYCSSFNPAKKQRMKAPAGSFQQDPKSTNFGKLSAADPPLSGKNIQLSKNSPEHHKIILPTEDVKSETCESLSDSRNNFDDLSSSDHSQ